MKNIEMVEKIFGWYEVEAIKALDEGKILVDCKSVSSSGMSARYRFFVYIDGRLYNMSRFFDFFYRLPSKVKTIQEISDYYCSHRLPKSRDPRSVTVQGLGFDRIEYFLHLVMDVLIKADILDKRNGHFNAKYEFFE